MKEAELEAKLEDRAVFLDLWQDKLFLGREFLTWLWLFSEIEGNLFKIEPQGYVEVWVENRLYLENGQGAEKRSVACQTPLQEWAEAHTALKEGKKLARARLRLRAEEKEWGFTLNAETLTPQSVKFPKTFSPGEDLESESLGARFLERAALLSELLGLLEALYKRFLDSRLSPAWEAQVLPRLNKWLIQQR